MCTVIAKSDYNTEETKTSEEKLYLVKVLLKNAMKAN